MLTDADGHLFIFHGGPNSGWLYIVTTGVHDDVISTTLRLPHYFEQTGSHFSGKGMTMSDLEPADQKYIKDWLVKHPSGTLIASPPIPPAASTGVARQNGRQFVDVADTTGVLKGRTITAISEGFDTTLALCADGALVAWGNNTYGQLGNGEHGLGNITPNTTGYAISPVLVHRPGALKDKKIVSIAANFENGYALCSDGSMYAWGHANAPPSSPLATVDEPVLFNDGALKGRKVVAIVANSSDTFQCALCSDGTLVGWFEWPSFGRPGTGSYGRVPTVLDTRGLLAGKTIKTLGINAVLCTDGTLAVWSRVTPMIRTFPGMELFIVKMDGILEGKKIVAMANDSQFQTLMVLCSDGTLIGWSGSQPMHIVSKGGVSVEKPVKPPPHPDAKATTISAQDVRPVDGGAAAGPKIISGTGALKGKTVVGLEGSLIRCSDGTAAYWTGEEQPQVPDFDGALADKTILAICSVAPNSPPLVLFKEPATAIAAAPAQPAPSPGSLNTQSAP